ncbi:MAG: competence/damage-inducible protein A [Paludibacteraceae bacterium]|nr:competence/damage-inducible protein A [Paludibacteraceae bacterium]
MKQTEIITIGDELLIGQVVDTNSAWMAERLNEVGVSIKQITSVHDDRTHILQALQEAEKRADLVLITGGLGPTKDDITKKVLCEYFNTELIYNQSVRSHLERLYAGRPDVLNRLTDTQCLLPKDCTIIENKVGSAQGMLFEKNGVTFISMPGVPYEMQYIMEKGILPMLEKEKGEEIVHRTLQVYGISESGLAILIEPWEEQLPSTMHLAYLPKDGIIRLRLSGYGVNAEAVENELAKVKPLLREHMTDRLPESVNHGVLFAEEDKTIEVLLGELLKSRGETIASAESCTGGKIAHLLNKHAGSSSFYWGSVVAYDNSVKRNVLGVQAADLEQFGAVSEPVVRQMAEGVRRVMNTTYGVATSGVAGPDGGTPEKPVGTVWTAIATPHGTYAYRFQLGKLRDQITDRATQVLLIWLFKMLKEA